MRRMRARSTRLSLRCNRPVVHAGRSISRCDYYTAGLAFVYEHVEFLLNMLVVHGSRSVGGRDSSSCVQLYCISLYQVFLSSSRKPLVPAAVGLAIAHMIVRATNKHT